MGLHRHLDDGLRAELTTMATASLVLSVAISWAPQPHAPPTPSPARVTVTKGFDKPEAVVYDPTTDCYYVSNVGGPVGIKDGKGFISRVHSDGTIDKLRFIDHLNSPMGSRVRGDTLFVLDVDVLHKFDLRSGRLLGDIDFSRLGPHILNDFDWGPGGAIYVTDMGMIANPNGQPEPGADMRLLEARRGEGVAVAFVSKALETPDGIAWDPSAHRFIITPFGGDTIRSWGLGDTKLSSVTVGAGQFDGIEVEHDGAIYLTSWSAGTMYRLDGHRLLPMVTGLTSPSDVTMDTKRHRVGITEMNPGDFQIWDLTGHVAAK